jgi:membrane associated rhomboid family serine protease
MDLEVGTAVRVTPSRQRADEWAVVLAAADIGHRLRERVDGWAVIVSPDDVAAALEALDAYDRENAGEPRTADDEVAASRRATVAGIAVAVLLLWLFAMTGPRAARGPWFERGSADAARILAGEWWRTVTALGLHADAPHVLANAVAVALLAPAVCRYVGVTVGWSLLLVAGAGGNLLTAYVHGPGHVSVGASTAVFGAIGVLAALRIVAPDRTASTRRKWWVVVAAVLALLAMLGTSPDADVLAHLFGLLVGAALGLIVGLARRARGA